MTTDDLVTRLLRLWDNVPAGDGAHAAFREVYEDPVIINGTAMSIEDLVARARITARAIAERSTEVISQVVGADALAVVFTMRGRHVGALPTPFGDIAGTGQPLELRVIDVLQLRAGRIEQIWMVADYLGALAATGAIRVPDSD